MSQKSSNQKKGQSSSGGQKGKRKERYLLTGCIALFIALFSLLFGKELPGGVKGLLYSFLEGEESFRDTGGDELTVTYLDVGQADCTVLQCGGYTMMIDGGGRGTAEWSCKRRQFRLNTGKREAMSCRKRHFSCTRHKRAEMRKKDRCAAEHKTDGGNHEKTSSCNRAWSSDADRKFCTGFLDLCEKRDSGHR